MLLIRISILDFYFMNKKYLISDIGLYIEESGGSVHISGIFKESFCSYNNEYQTAPPLHDFMLSIPNPQK